MDINGINFRVAQAKALMSGRELSEATQISEATLSKIRRGGYNARPKTIGKLAAALNVPVEYLTEQRA